MITTYLCEYCHCQSGNGYRDPESCRVHEAICDHNPQNKSCATCKHYDWSPDYDGDDDRTPFWCKLFKDQTWRRQCDKHEPKRAKSPND